MLFGLCSITRFFVLILATVEHCFMEEGARLSDNISSALSISSLSSLPLLSSPSALSLSSSSSLPSEAQPIELVGPKDFEALSEDLVVLTRLSPLVFNLTGALDEGLTLPAISIRLLFVNWDGSESLLTSQSLPSPITTFWQNVIFECSLIVRGGRYSVRLVKDDGVNSSSNYAQNLESINNITINARFPTIFFEVPHRIQAYTTSTVITFGFTKTTCKPRLSLPSTFLTLSICSQKKTDGEAAVVVKQEDSLNGLSACNRDFATVYREPLRALQKEGHIRMNVECHLWARNATYRVQLREKSTKAVIAKSLPIQVEWGSQFRINISQPTVMPCRGSIRAYVSYPGCVLPGKDKIRIYGHETISVPSLLVPSRLSYIGEQQIRPNNKVVTFRCNLFPQRFLRFCFQYINTAVDDSVAVVVEKCIPTNPPLMLSDGGWGPWSSWTTCSVTCGIDGKHFRYRFCDNPPPSSGANFCQGDAIEERPCDSGAECPQDTSLVLYIDGTKSGESVANVPPGEDEDFSHHHHHHQQNHKSLREWIQQQQGNLSTTSGCECGCILYDLVPRENYTLVIFLTSNQSSPCADEDEVDQHKLRWILHAKDERDRLRLDIIDVEVQCVRITFRDGNTTDSNLLQVIPSYQEEQEQNHYEDLFTSQSSKFQLQDNGDKKPNLYDTLTLESTGASLSIATAPNSNKNCSGQFIYFMAYYSTLPPDASAPALLEATGGNGSGIPYEFWTFLVLKLILLFFIVVVVLSGFGGCLTKAYRKYKYKELKCFDNDDEEGCLEGTSNPGGDDDTSRCTSVTLMSFDYTYWRRLRLLRLKYFLLRPLQNTSAKVKSFPSTPTHHRVARKKVLEKGPVSSSLSPDPRRRMHKSQCKLSKSISLSETNLRVKVDVVGAEALGMKEVESRREGGAADGAKSRRTRTICCGDPLGSRLVVGSTSVSNSFNGSEPTSVSISISTTTNPSLSETSEGKNKKFLKECENLKRKASNKDLLESKHQERRKYSKKKMQSNLTNNKTESNKEQRELVEMTERGLVKRDIGKSQLSMATSLRLSSSCGEEDSRGASRAEMEDADHDFEMDYYDYDVMNVGTIPGSYLGLEPAFVLWNSEVYQQAEQGSEDTKLDDEGMMMGERKGDNLIIPMKISDEASSSNNTSYHEDSSEFDGEIMSKTASTSLGIFSDLNFSKRQITVKETSLDTLKFADEEDSDDNATQASDSIFDNEHDLINDPDSRPSLTSCI